eukprot:PITA_23882
MLLASKIIIKINRLNAQMARTFDMKDLGAARQILGMEIFRNMSNDISHAVGVVSRYMANPVKEHWSIVKWVLWYLTGTSDYCITYNRSSEFVCGYVDSNFAGDLDKRRSTSGYVFTLAGGAISWMSKLQNIVALSTTEAEYIAASHACKEVIWLKGLFGEFGRLQDNIKLFCDSQSAIHLAKNPAYHSKSKHIPIKYHFVRQVITERGVSLEKVHTKENCADMFTKPVLLEKLQWFWLLLACRKNKNNKETGYQPNCCQGGNC